MASAAKAHRDRAIKVALRHIDGHLGEVSDHKAQDEVLEGLIKRYGLRDQLRPHSSSTDTREKKLTVTRYRDILRGILRQATRSGTKRYNIYDLFERGSDLLPADFAITFKTNAASGIADSEGESDDARVVQQGRPRDRLVVTVATPNDITARDRRTESQRSFREPAIVGKALPPPQISPITPVKERSVQATKRKIGHETESEADAAVSTKVIKLTEAVDLTTPAQAPSDTIVVRNWPSARQEDNGSVPEASVSRDDTEARNGVSNTYSKTRGLVRISDDEITERVDAIWNDIQTFTRRLLKGLKIKGDQKAAVVTNPQPDLEQLYIWTFGEQWLKRTCSLISAGDITAQDLMEACVAAAMYGMTLRPPLPWKQPKDILASLSEDANQIDRVLRESDPLLNLETVVWQAARNKVLDLEFQEKAIRPEAEHRAYKFMIIINQQLEHFGMAAAKDTTELWRQKRTEDMSSIFIKALVLKGEIRAAPEYYEICWPISKARVDEGMVQLHAGKGKQEVILGVTPRIRKAAKLDAEQSLVCPAKVLSRPLVNG